MIKVNRDFGGLGREIIEQCLLGLGTKEEFKAANKMEVGRLDSIFCYLVHVHILL